jgi:hypothetical protein
MGIVYNDAGPEGLNGSYPYHSYHNHYHNKKEPKKEPKSSMHEGRYEWI